MASKCCQRDHGDSLVHPGKSCTRMRSMEAPTEADLRHHHDVALAPNLEAGGLQPDPHCDSNSSHLSGWYLSLEITDEYLLGLDIFYISAKVKKYIYRDKYTVRAPL